MLIVEDDPFVQKVVKKVFAGMGFEVLSCGVVKAVEPLLLLPACVSIGLAGSTPAYATRLPTR